MSVDLGVEFFVGLFKCLVFPIPSSRGEQMASEIPLDWSQHVVNNTVILLRPTLMLKGTKLYVATDVFETKYVNKQ